MALGEQLRTEFDQLEHLCREHSQQKSPIAPPFFAKSSQAKPNQAKSRQTEATPRRCPELDCIRALIPGDVIAAVERRAQFIGIGADRVVISAGLIDEETYLRALADAVGVEFEPLDWTPRDHCPLSDELLIDAPAAGLLPKTVAGGTVLVVAPRGYAARRICEIAKQRPDLARRVRLTTSDRLHRFVFRHAGNAIGYRATQSLHASQPVMSAAPPRWRNSAGFTIAIGGLAFAAFVIEPHASLIVFELMLAVIFLTWIALRLVGAVIKRPNAPAPVPIPDSKLPIYTIMVALYREATSVGALLAAIRNIDYPPEKLDVKIIVEADDHETREALAKVGNVPPFEIVVVPEIGPRTKPKALNAALPFARGSFLTIYDAEDRPNPGQLRRALDVFLSDSPALACVQASLTIDNTADNWLTALFTAEYAGQFDVFLPALEALNLPLPLGGSSNHFRTATLRKVGAWDPFNVTEDADLGLRIARFGYRSRVIASATYEEAPAQLGPWLRQRTRWFKGWLQTWLVHMREPRRLVGELGIAGFVALQLMVGGNVLAALVHPIFLIGILIGIAQEETWLHSQLATTLLGLSVVFGYLTSALLGVVGLIRRGLIRTAWVLPLIPVHWLLLAIAAWRALAQLITNPYRWEKTNHGLARTSRLARRHRVDTIVAHILAPATARDVDRLKIAPQVGRRVLRPPLNAERRDKAALLVQ